MMGHHIMSKRSRVSSKNVAKPGIKQFLLVAAVVLLHKRFKFYKKKCVKLFPYKSA